MNELLSKGTPSVIVATRTRGQGNFGHQSHLFAAEVGFRASPVAAVDVEHTEDVRGALIGNDYNAERQLIQNFSCHERSNDYRCLNSFTS